MKRIISLILTVFMLAALSPMSIMAATTFKDVQSTDYYAAASSSLADKGILQGYPDGTFGAARAITRAEMAAIVCRMIDADTKKENLKSDFTDVADNHWAIAYISVASEKKIINGDGDGTFRPEDDVKHEEAIKMVVCALGLVGEDIKVDPVDWSAAYIKIADENGITKNLVGVKGNKSTRGDIAVMVYNGIVPKVNAPTASVEAGTYTSSKKVSLKSDTEGAEIYYTTNGNTPTAESTKYTKEITISKSCTLKAVAIFDGVFSDILSVEYTIKSSSGGSGGGKFDFEAPEEGNIGTGSNDSNSNSGGTEDQTPEEPAEPTEEEINTSNQICEDLEAALEDINYVEETLGFSGKTADVIVYVKKDIELTLQAADDGTIISNQYVRTTYVDDITEVKAIIDSMNDEEFAEFKRVMMEDIATYTMMALIKHFDINTNYRQ